MYFFKSYYIKEFCALHRLPISFSNDQGNFIRNLKKKKIYIYIYINFEMRELDFATSSII